METTTYIGISRQMVLRQHLDIIAGNLANLETSGYKGQEMLFSEYLSETEDDEQLSFVLDQAVYSDLSDGPLMITENPLDIAIAQEGYFTIETPSGLQYTRGSRFHLDADGQIVTAKGYPLLDDAGQPITVPPHSAPLQINKDGSVVTAFGPLARLQPVTFENRQALVRAEDGLYIAEDQDPIPILDGEVLQGAVEGSNVKAVVEMTKMIEVLRSYQAATKLVEQEHERQTKAIDSLVAA